MSARSVTCGLIGDHIGRSQFSAALGMICDHHGVAFEFTPIDTAGIEDFDFDAQVDLLISDGWTGVTVTHPHKLAARNRLGPAMSEDVAHLSASNLMHFGPPMKGFNTDYTGFLGAWRAAMGDAAPGKVSVAGAGGVAGAIVPALEALGARDVAVWDTADGRAEALANQCGPAVRAVKPADAANEIAASDGLVNATALGMGDDMRSAFDASHLGAQNWAFDAVYTPVDTPFLVAARVAGLQTISGFDLFRHMILGSFEAYSGIAPDAVALLPKIDLLKPGG